jgi:hypothetical protein
VQHLKYIILALGRNHLADRTPREILNMFKDLIAVVREKFPTCEIMLCSILPRSYYTMQANEDVKLTKAQEDTNKLLSEFFIGQKEYSFVKYADVTQYFYDEVGEAKPDAFLVDAHFTMQGFNYLEEGIKFYINKYYSV